MDTPPTATVWTVPCSFYSIAITKEGALGALLCMVISSTATVRTVPCFLYSIASTKEGALGAQLFLPLPQFEQFLVHSTVLPPLNKAHSVHCYAWILLPLPQFEQFLFPSTVLSPLGGALSALLPTPSLPQGTVPFSFYNATTRRQGALSALLCMATPPIAIARGGSTPPWTPASRVTPLLPSWQPENHAEGQIKHV